MVKNYLTPNDKILIIISLILLTAYLIFYPQIFPESSLRLPLTESQIVQRSVEFLESLGYETSNFANYPILVHNKDLLHYLQKKFGLEKTNEIIKENKIPVFFWKVRFRKAGAIDNILNLSYESEENAKAVINEMLSDTVNVSVSPDGKIIGFYASINKNQQLKPISYQRAFQLASDFLNKYKPSEFVNYQLVTDKVKQPSNNNQYKFKWENIENIFEQKEIISVNISGEKISQYIISLEPVKPVKLAKKRADIEEIPTMLLFILLFIFMLILLIQKLRKDLIEVKRNIGISVVITIAWTYILFQDIGPTKESNIFVILILPLLITSPFIFLSFLGASSIGESETRDVWHDKLFSVDVLRNGTLFFPQLSLGFLRGLALAFISTGTLAILFKLFSLKFNFFMYLDDEKFYHKLSCFPVLYVFAKAVLNIGFGESVFRLFLVSFLKKKIRDVSLLVSISVLVWIFIFKGYSDIKLSSYPINLFINFVLGVYFVIFFIKYDFFTVLWGAFAYYLLRELYPLSFLEYQPTSGSGYVLWGIFLLVVIIALYGFRKNIQAEEIHEYIPDYVKRQEERKRILRELEIARRVQHSFLPQSNPQITGIDIASICIPATEVGGDYYDFIQLDDHRLGTVIGDVSGKGISAAFHMTLTKGFLKSQAKSSSSPRQILINLNELFYENVERGTFISMIYGIFDLKLKEFTFSRAGHNPLIIKKQDLKNIELLCPRGIALGLEKGKIFSQVIEEYTIGFQPNDIFMFYTDGFSEAMNLNKMEFGEERLQKILDKFSFTSAENIIQEVKSQIFSFIGEASQHDDMTMIVVKILS